MTHYRTRKQLMYNGNNILLYYAKKLYISSYWEVKSPHIEITFYLKQTNNPDTI